LNKLKLSAESLDKIIYAITQNINEIEELS